MGLTGKYKFDGISNGSAAALIAALSANPSTAFLPKIPFFRISVTLLFNLMANQGLVVMNLGGYYVNGVLDEKGLKNAIESGIIQVDGRDDLTQEEKDKIDDQVIKAARKALPYGRKPTKP